MSSFRGRLACKVGGRNALVVAAALILALAISAGQAMAGGRVALVIGEGAYEHAPKLENPVNDANDISDALKGLGFDVLTGINQTQQQLFDLLTRFEARARTSDVALFYFAGHAFQVGGQNYLVPTDLTLNDASKVVPQTLALDKVIAVLNAAPGVRLVFLDACRNNPLGLSRVSGGEGLARVGSSADFLIAYATQPGAVAYDGDGRNGTFSGALLSHIRSPSENIGDMMIDVRKDVIAATGGLQIPWDSSSLTRQFQFDPRPPSASPETLMYQVAARSKDPALLNLYLDRYPGGAHVQDVMRTLSADAKGGEAAPQQRAVASDANSVNEGEQLWQLAQQTRIRQLYNSYIKLYPGGQHVDAARKALAALPTPADIGPGRQCELLATHPRDATASTAGVPFEELAKNATRAISACTQAMQAYPKQPRYEALLARAKAAAGLRDEAVTLYKEASDRGDLRAMVSLGLLYDTGDGVPKDPARALELYARAASLGSADGAINYAVALFKGDHVAKDVPRALKLLDQASQGGSAIATFNLGVLAQQGAYGSRADALPLFQRAAREGEPKAYRAAAVLLDEGRGVPKDPEKAADLLLRGAASDDGEIIEKISDHADTWTKPTIEATQRKLKAANYYDGAIDGVAGPQLVAALRTWRNGGFNEKVLGS